MSTPAKLVADYERGATTLNELLTRLVQAAADADPAALALAIPAEYHAELRRLTTVPPDRPESMRFAVWGAFVGPVDHEAVEQDQQRRYHAGAWRWNAYFADGAAE